VIIEERERERRIDVFFCFQNADDAQAMSDESGPREEEEENVV